MPLPLPLTLRLSIQMNNQVPRCCLSSWSNVGVDGYLLIMFSSRTKILNLANMVEIRQQVSFSITV